MREEEPVYPAVQRGGRTEEGRAEEQNHAAVAVAQAPEGGVQLILVTRKGKPDQLTLMMLINHEKLKPEVKLYCCNVTFYPRLNIELVNLYLAYFK